MSTESDDGLVGVRDQSHALDATEHTDFPGDTRRWRDWIRFHRLLKGNGNTNHFIKLNLAGRAIEQPRDRRAFDRDSYDRNELPPEPWRRRRIRSQGSQPLHDHDRDERNLSARWLKAVPSKRYLNLASSGVLVDLASKALRRSETTLACGRKMEIPLPVESDYPEEILGSDLSPELRVGCAKAYFKTNFLTRRLFRRRVEIAFDFISDQQWKRGLDAGTGAGFILPALAARCREVDGVDLSPMIKYTQAMLDKRGLHNVKLAQADLAHLPYPDQAFDLVVCLSVIEHIPDPDLVLREMARLLQPNGVLILGYPLENYLFTSLKTLAILELRLRRFIQGQRVTQKGEAFHPHVTDGRGLKPTVERIFGIELQRDIRVVGFPVYRILKVRKASAEL